MRLERVDTRSGAYAARVTDETGDLAVRLAAFDWLREQVAIHGDVLPRGLLADGFIYRGEQVHLVGPQGIFKPRACRYPISIVTIPDGGPYPDLVEGDILHYSYRGIDPLHSDNVGLREAMRDQVKLILFVRVAENRYLVRQPIMIVGDDPASLKFEVDLQPGGLASGSESRLSEAPEIERRYAVAWFRRRVHQRAFREQVLAAYREQCALCRLHHQELLDAAHIVGDAEDEGDPIVSNGLALCKLHHAAFDSFFLTVRPDYTIEVKPSILEETDGPMLVVGLKELHGQRIQLPRAPRDRPDILRLEHRYERFLRAS